MIIDALTHVHPNPKSFGAKYDLSPEFLIANLEESPIDKAIVTAIHADNQYGTRTEYVAEVCERYPDQIIGFASVHPLNEPDAPGLLERYVQELGMRGLKLHPRHQKIAVDDERIVPVVEKAAELGIPVAVCGSQWKHAPLRDQLPQNIDVLCKRVPEASIIICHSGGFHFMDAFVVAVANDNVYLETSIALRYFQNTPFEDQYVFALKQLGARRVIYGSDHPEDPAKDCYENSRALLAKHGFADADLAQIFGGNIAKLIRL